MPLMFLDGFFVGKETTTISGFGMKQVLEMDLFVSTDTYYTSTIIYT